ncbi:unnamed protein product [Rhizophagus irregularis]|nr:unnamed protein product [Rhizophagus irregularis]CAB5159751.1 unnamed protein product [Rhizophagus irregularis]CAB5361482.1 unnamed protein product [Rhizophagus irregularis]
MMNSSVFARSTIRSRVLTRPMRDGAYHWENVDELSLYIISISPSALRVRQVLLSKWVYSLVQDFLFHLSPRGGNLRRPVNLFLGLDHPQVINSHRSYSIA